MRPVVRDISFTPASAADARTGLMGFTSFVVNELRLDGVTVRRTQSGGYSLSYPTKKARGRKRPFIRPVNDAARRAIEHAVLSRLGFLRRMP